jgi:hypothetical protein
MKGKPQKAQNWLPSQVAYGVDCSDSDPSKWKAFGADVDAQELKHARSEKADASAAGQQGKSTPAVT